MVCSHDARRGPREAGPLPLARLRRASALLLLLALCSCDRALGLGGFSVSRAADGGSGVCAPGEPCDASACQGGRCAALFSEDCATVTGPMNDLRAILIGSLFSTSGAQAATNLARQQSAILAVEEINAAGGVNVGDAERRPLLMVSCDESHDLLRAGRHLINELGVRAIVGPNTSQDTLDLTTKLSIAAGTVVISPTAVAGDIADLLDDDSSWLMVPNDAQRAPLMAARIHALEMQLRAERSGRALRLGVLLRDDVLGRGARVALSSLTWNGASLASAQNLSAQVRIDNYDPSGDDAERLVADYAAFAPDVIVMVGTAETITQLMQPLERLWTAPDHPQYVLTDSSKVPELLDAVRMNDALRARISGTGVRPLDENAAVHTAFTRAYRARFYADGDATSGMGQAYDATYAIAHAYAGAHSAAVSGEELARGLRLLHGGASQFAVGGTSVRSAQSLLSAGTAIDLFGTFAPLHWDERGAVLEGAIELWCIAADGGVPAYAGSGLSYDVASGQMQGSFHPCGGVDGVATSVGTPRAGGSAPDADGDADGGVPPPPPPPPVSRPMSSGTDSGPAPTPTATPVMCGSAACAAGEACCVGVSAPGLPTSSAAISCGDATTALCAQVFACSRDSDCGSGMQCCWNGSASTTTIECLPVAQSCAGARFQCHSARDCASGQQCCSHFSVDGSAYLSTTCQATCDDDGTSSPLCERDGDCSPDLTCRVSSYLANLSVCGL